MSPSSACIQLHSEDVGADAVPPSGSMLTSRSGSGGGVLARAHVGPDHAAALAASGRPWRWTLLLEVALGRLGRHVDAGAGRRRTSSRGRRSAGPPLRCGRRTATRRGAGRSSATRPTAPDVVAEGDEVLAQQPDAHRRAVRRRQLVEQQAGIQYWRIRSPIGVPGPTRVSSSLSC